MQTDGLHMLDEYWDVKDTPELDYYYIWTD